METSNPAAPFPNSTPITDLKVTIQDTAVILPPPLHEQHPPLFLSNIDQKLDYYVRSVHFFAPNPSYDQSNSSVVETLKRAVGESLLGPFRFLAGRLKRNAGDGRLEIGLCDPVGVEFLVAQSEFALAEIGDLVFPHPAFGQQLVFTDLIRGDAKLLISFQVTKFKCGGFCMGICFNHVAFDGVAFRVYLQCLAALAANEPLPVAPFTDRTLLAARRPPCPISPPKELLQAKPPLTHYAAHFNVKVFKLTALDITNLKRIANGQHQSEADAKSTKSGFCVVTALVWICKALSDPAAEKDPDRLSKAYFAVDVRRKLNPPLPDTYVGNAVLPAYATATRRELETWSFGKIVDKVAEGVARIKDEYVRSVIDWAEAGGEFQLGDFVVSALNNLGFEKVEYPWGRAKYLCRVDYDRKDLIVLSSSQVGNDDGEGEAGRGVSVLLSMPSDQMIRFEELLYCFLHK